LKIDIAVLDGSSMVATSVPLKVAARLAGVVHHGRNFEGLELFIMLIEAEQEGSLTLANKSTETSLTCLFALEGQAVIGPQRLDAGWGWHAYGLGNIDPQFSSKTCP